MFTPFVTFKNNTEDYYNNSNISKLYTEDSLQDYLQGINFSNPDGIPRVIQQNVPEENLMIQNTTTNEMKELNPKEEKTKSSSTTSKEALENGQMVVDSLMSRLNMTKEQATGVAGVIMAESGLNPASYNKAEKAGKLKSSKANGPGYGAGMLQWSMDRKKEALKLIGKNKPIEELSIGDQIDMLIGELQGPYKNTLEGILQCKTPSEAAATMYCHNVGGFSRSRLPATQTEIDAMNRKYSKFANNQINKGMDYAEKLFQELD